MINLYHLKYFADAAEGGGVSAAARKNFLTQSAVSRAIARLEQDLEVQLVHHRQNRFQITEAGEAVLEKSRVLFDTLTRLKELATDFQQVPQGPLRFGCNQAIAGRLIGPMLEKIEARYPKIQPVLRLGNTDQIQGLIESQEIDFGIVLDDGEVGSRYQTQRIYSGHFLVVKSPKMKKPPLDHLIVSRTQKGGMSQKYFAEYRKAYGQTLTPKLVISSWQVILDLAVSGYGSALVPEFLCNAELKRGKLEVVKHKVRPLPFHLCTIVARNKRLPRNAEALLECFKSLGAGEHA